MLLRISSSIRGVAGAILRVLVICVAGLLVGVLLGVAIGVGFKVLELNSLRDVRHRPASTDPPIKTLVVSPSDDAGKAGSVHGVMGWRFFEIPAGVSARSEDELRFQFTAPAEILQIDISVDINDPRATLVEFAAGINSTRGYGQYRSADWLMQASWSRPPLTRGEIDETVRLPPGVQVAAGDFVGISGWLGGAGTGDPLRVSPEVVILYRWLPSG